MGRRFKDQALTDYFSKFDWYRPTIDGDNFSEDRLNEYQIANRDLVIAYEEEKGNNR